MSHPKRTWAGLRNGSARRLSGKRRRTEGSAATAMQGEEVPIEVRQMRRAVHQFGLVGGEYYDSKEERLQQILDRLPADSGTTLIFAKNAQQASGVVERCKRKALLTAAKGRAERVKAVFDGAGDEESAKPWACGRCTLENAWMLEECSACGTRRGFFPKVSVVTMDEKASRTAQWTSSCQILINYDLPRSLSEYLRRLTAIDTVESFNPRFPRVVYTFLEEPQLKNRSAKDLVELLKTTQRYVPAAKKAEIDSALGLIDTTKEDEDWEEEEEDDEDWDDDDWEACDCAHCRGSILGSTSYHPLLEIPDFKHKDMSGIEVVRLPLKALEDFDKAVPFIAPRVSGHSCTLICLHCLNVHTPWDGWEQFFAPSELTGTMRVVLVLAEGVSWHEYPDCALLGAGGSAWIDVLDMDSMDRSDMLLERLVDHEAALLNGHSERIVLMGMSQGGGQSMLRFLRSKIRLGGWIGSVCHVPTAPHTPRSRDPLLVSSRPTVNRSRPVRLLAGESDCVFAPSLVLSDAARLRDVGSFTDVQVEVRKGLAHEGWLPDAPKTKGITRSNSFKDADTALRRAKSFAKAEKACPDLLFLQRHLPIMVDFATPAPETC